MDLHLDTVQAFFSRFPDERAGLAGRENDLARRLEEMYEQGRTSWPRFQLPRERFAVFLGNFVEGRGGDLLDFLTNLHAADLYLACGCELGIPAALETFDSTHLIGIDRFVKVIRAEPVFIDEVRQSLRHKLFVSDGSARPKISSYTGRGSLKNWIGVVAQRTALSLLRRADSASMQPIDDEVEAAALGDPEIHYLRTHYGVVFQKAFCAALATLSERERLILRLNIVNGVSFDRIARMYDVNQSTVSRWAAAAKQAVRDDVHRFIAERLKLTTDEFASLFRILQSDLAVSISQAFGSEQAVASES
jgi:RNA polymerase sigma-70 factor, ECF subfamily